MSAFVSLQAPALAERHDQPLTVSYAIQARAEPGVMPRVVGLFAKRGLVPRQWHSTASASALSIEVQIGGIAREPADYIARCLRQVVGVETVLTSETPPPA